MRFVITVLVAAVLYGLGQHFLGSNFMFWTSLGWLAFLGFFALVGRLRK